MSETTKRRRLPWRSALTAATCAALVATPPGAHAAEGDVPGAWDVSVESLDTGVRSGYQLALDPVNDQVYVADAQWRVDAKVTGTVESTPGANSMRTTFSPYGVAVDGTLGEEGVIVTTTARQRDPDSAFGYGGGVVIYDAAQGGPTDADRVFDFEDGSPILAGPRRVAVNTNTHYAFVTNLGASRSSMGPGFILVLDLTKRGAAAVVARVGLPDEQPDTNPGWWTNPTSGGVTTEGVVGVAVDEANNLVYLGTMNGQNLYVLDADQIDGTKNNKDTQAYAGAITKLDAVVGDNARPTYNPTTKKVYVSAYDDSTITVVNADPTDTTTYGTVDKVIDVTTDRPTGNRGTNAVEIDAERGLLYSANLDAGVSVYDINNDYQQITFNNGEGGTFRDIPTSGRAVNFGLDEATGKVWVSTWGSTGKVDILELTAPSLGFPDVPASNPFYDYIIWAAGQGITTGYEDGTFRPADPIARDAVAAMLFRALNPGADKPLCATGESPFTDVPDDHQFCGEIAWLKAEGITTGFTDGSYRPATNIARDAMAAFMARVYGPDTLPACAEAPFTDIPVTHAFCKEITWVKAEGITTGWPDNTFRPVLPIERQAFVAFLHRAEH